MIQKILGARAPLSYIFKNKTAKLLSGDPQAVKDSISIGESLGFRQTFCSGILSWAPNEKPTEKQIHEVIESHRELIEAGMPLGSVKSVYVAHYDRDHFHIHWLVGEEVAGKKFSPYFARQDFKTFDLWKRLQNEKFNWTNPEKTPHQDRVDVLRTPRNVSPQVKDEFEALKVEASVAYSNGLFSNRDDFFQWLEDSGFEPQIEKRIGTKGKSKGKELESISIKNCDGKRRTIRGLLSYEHQYPTANERSERATRDHEKRGVEKDPSARILALEREFDSRLQHRIESQKRKYGKRVENALTRNRRSPLSMVKVAKLFGFGREAFAIKSLLDIGKWFRGRLCPPANLDLPKSKSLDLSKNIGGTTAKDSGFSERRGIDYENREALRPPIISGSNRPDHVEKAEPTNPATTDPTTTTKTGDTNTNEERLPMKNQPKKFTQEDEDKAKAILKAAGFGIAAGAGGALVNHALSKRREEEKEKKKRAEQNLKRTLGNFDQADNI